MEVPLLPALTTRRTGQATKRNRGVSPDPSSYASASDVSAAGGPEQSSSGQSHFSIV